MRVSIYDKNKKHIASFVAKTSRGFNKQQKREIAKIQKQLAENKGLMEAENGKQ